MVYNSEADADDDNNLDDLIQLTKAEKKSRCYTLVVEDYDKKGVFSKPPTLFGLSQVTHSFTSDDLYSTTFAGILGEYPDLLEYIDSEDKFNLTTSDGIRVKAQDAIARVFQDGTTEVLLYVQNRSFATCNLVTETQALFEEEELPAKRAFNWRKCMVTFMMCWISKLIITAVVLLALRYFEYI